MKETVKEIIKGVPIRIEYGDYDNFATMIPIEILEHRPNEWSKVLIRWQYPNSDHTIDLWQQSDKNVDFESFGFKR